MEHLSIQLVAFAIASVPVVWLSWRSLKSRKNHGFYRFFSWECILWLLIWQVLVWFRNPLSWHQILSWILLVTCCYPVLAGVYQLKKAHRIDQQRKDPSLFGFESTTHLVTTGIFHYIRHPMYSSLLILAWGVAMKNPGPLALLIAALASVLLYLTAVTEEKEDIAFFGDPYREYMSETKRFIPWIF